jgi:uncharacterized RmlC-like cupin family protein
VSAPPIAVGSSASVALGADDKQKTTEAISLKSNSRWRFRFSPKSHGEEEFMMTEYPPIRIIGPHGFDAGTAQTAGSLRLAAIAPQLGIQSSLWAGLLEVEPGARTGIHHHGEQQTVAYVLSGVCDVRWGACGEYRARAKAGDFLHVPAFLPHMEINPSDTDPFRWVVVRSTSAPIVVNLSDQFWPINRRAAVEAQL